MIDISLLYLVYLGHVVSQGDNNHTKIGMTGGLSNRKKSLDTSYSVYGMEFEYLILCDSEEEESKIEEHLHGHFWKDSTTHLEGHSGGLEWFQRRYQLEEIKEALFKGGFENKVVSDPNEIEEILREHKKYYESEKENYMKEMKKLNEEINRSNISEQVTPSRDMREHFGTLDNIEYKPNKYQIEIIEKTKRHYEINDKGIIILPCGTGKTVLGSFICEDYNKILICVPSKILINQWREKIKSILPEHHLMIVNIDDKFMNTKHKKIVVISTYHSCHKIKGIFDMKIGDECHHLVGENKNEKGFKYFHKIESNKTLFLTATKKIVVQKENQRENYSMDDICMFGEIIYEKNLQWAIENKLITDYNLICLKNNEETIQDIMRKCKIDDGNIELFLSAFISLKSLVKYEGLSHILIYTNTTKTSEKIIDYINIILENELIDINKEDLYHNSLHSNSNHDITSEIDKFKNSLLGIISCVYIFGEGFDLPKLNGVVFAENMESDIRIIQSTTRCFRLNKDEPKKKAFVIIPYLDKDDWNDDNESFQKLRKIVYQIRNEDKNIEHKIRIIDINKEKDYSIQNIFYRWKKLAIKGKDHDDNDPFIDDEEESGLNKLKLRLRKAGSLKSRFDSEEHELYEYMKERNKELNLKSKSEYNLSKRSPDYIEDPESKFGLWWKNWYSFLGYDTSKFIQTKEEWIIECKKNIIKSLEDYKRLCENDVRFPINPGEFYENYTNFNNELNLNTQRRR